jgi:hypothetical protein
VKLFYHPDSKPLAPFEGNTFLVRPRLEKGPESENIREDLIGRVCQTLRKDITTPTANFGLFVTGKCYERILAEAEQDSEEIFGGEGGSESIPCESRRVESYGNNWALTRELDAIREFTDDIREDLLILRHIIVGRSPRKILDTANLRTGPRAKKDGRLLPRYLGVQQSMCFKMSLDSNQELILGGIVHNKLQLISAPAGADDNFGLPHLLGLLVFVNHKVLVSSDRTRNQNSCFEDFRCI